MSFKIHTGINGCSFNIDEAAYIKLSEYRKSISETFASFNDSAEIISDIDMRISEILCESVSTSEHIVTSKHIDNVIHLIGTPEILKENTGDSIATSNTATRIPSHKILANPRTIAYGILWIILLLALGFVSLNIIILLIKALFAFGGIEIWRYNPLYGKWIINPALYNYNVAQYALLWLLSCAMVIGIPIAILFQQTGNTLKQSLHGTKHIINRRTYNRIWGIWTALLIIAISGYYIISYCASHFQWELLPG